MFLKFLLENMAQSATAGLEMDLRAANFAKRSSPISQRGPTRWAVLGLILSWSSWNSESERPLGRRCVDSAASGSCSREHGPLRDEANLGEYDGAQEPSNIFAHEECAHSPSREFFLPPYPQPFHAQRGNFSSAQS
jgi:hypothetical protein